MSSAVRHDDLRKRNRAMVIAAIRRMGQPSRTEIAATTGLSHSTISAISADLIQERVLAETKGADHAAIRRGRPQVALCLNPNAATVIVLVLSLNKLTAALVDYTGKAIAQEERIFTTAAISRTALVGELLSIVGRLMESRSLGIARPLRIVLAIQGITDAGARVMLWSPITPLKDLALADLLEHEFAIPATVQNDCNMMASGLRWRDPERYRDDFVGILLSHGIGMGLVLKGELFNGARSSGGEFGHMVHRPEGALCRCGRRGCIEAYACDYAIWRNALQLDECSAPDDRIDAVQMKALAARARETDGAEREAYRKAGAALGFGIGSLFALIDPAPVAFVGGGTAAFDLLEPTMRAALAQTAGGQHVEELSVDVIEDEMPLIRQGCAMLALSYVDSEVFAAGTSSRDEGARLPA